MKINKYMKVTILILIVFSLLTNFIGTQVAYAIDPITLTLGAKYTYDVAQALYLTILTATSVGVTFATIEEWKNYHDMIEGTSPGPIEQYPEWETARQETQQSKAELATNHWFEQWELQSLPGGGGDPDPKNNKKGILALMGGAGLLGGFISNFISMFQKLELQEGENIISGSDVTIINGYSISTKHRLVDYIYYIDVYINNVLIRTERYAPAETYYCKSIYDLKYNIRPSGADYKWEITGKRQWAYKNNDSNYILNDVNMSNYFNDAILNGALPEESTENIKINVNSDSPILDGSSQGETKYPQPNLIPIPRHNPTTQPLLNPDGKPKPGIQSIINPDGSIEDRFYGDIDDLLRDIVMNTPIDKILNPDTRPYEIIPGGDHIKITYPDPEPSPYPNPTPQTPVEPGNQLDYTPWFQSVINWLTNIWTKIPELEQENQVELIPPVEIDFSPLMGIELTEKFPFSLVSDVKKSVNMLIAPPEPPYFKVPMVDKEIIIDFEVFDKWAVITRNFLSLTFIIVLILITRRFIG